MRPACSIAPKFTVTGTARLSSLAYGCGMPKYASSCSTMAPVMPAAKSASLLRPCGVMKRSGVWLLFGLSEPTGPVLPALRTSKLPTASASK